MEFTVSTTDRTAVVDVTLDVERAVPADVSEGTCTVFVPHTTAGVVVNETEPRLLDDLEAAVADLVPTDGPFRQVRAVAHRRDQISMSVSRAV